MTTKKQLLRDIQIVSFVVKEAQLFLDTHPSSSEALEYFDYYNKLLSDLTTEYEANFGPLTVYGVDANNGWTWINEPWPWEKEA